jgi:outer membrane autotransporter protein
MTGNTSAAVLQPYATAEWRHEFENDARTVEYRYLFAVPGANPSFASPTDEPDEDWGQITVGLGAQLTNSFFAFAQYATTIGLDDSVVNAFTIGLRGRF